jgi:hypothetical protein
MLVLSVFSFCADGSTLLVSHKSKTLERIVCTTLTSISLLSPSQLLSLHLGRTEAITFAPRLKLCRSSEVRVELGGEVLTTKTSVSYLECILD